MFTREYRLIPAEAACDSPLQSGNCNRIADLISTDSKSFSQKDFACRLLYLELHYSDFRYVAIR